MKHNINTTDAVLISVVFIYVINKLEQVYECMCVCIYPTENRAIYFAIYKVMSTVGVRVS